MICVRAGMASGLIHPTISMMSHSISAQCLHQRWLCFRSQTGLLAFDKGQTYLRFYGEKKVASSLSDQTRRNTSLHYRADLLELAGIAPTVAAIYGASFLDGGLFACLRLATTWKPIPSGLLLGISAVTSAIFANAYFPN